MAQYQLTQILSNFTTKSHFNRCWNSLHQFEEYEGVLGLFSLAIIRIYQFSKRLYKVRFHHMTREFVLMEVGRFLQRSSQAALPYSPVMTCIISMFFRCQETFAKQWTHKTAKILAQGDRLNFPIFKAAK